MAARFQTLDEITAQRIGDRLVCPFIADCPHFIHYNQPDLNYLSYILRYCGDQFLPCRHYRARLAEDGDPPEAPGLEANAPRAGPT